jgi:hypothetical protein
MKQMHCVHRDMSPMHPRRDGIQQSVAGPFVTILPHGIVLWFVGVRPVVPVVGADGAVGVTNVEGVPSVDGLRPGIPIVEGEMPGTGTTTSGLTPALPISTEPIGIPGWETRLGDSEGVVPVEDAVPAVVAQVAGPPGKAVPAPIPAPGAIPPPS